LRKLRKLRGFSFQKCLACRLTGNSERLTGNSEQRTGMQ
jgi:hypothetical protein